MIILVADDHALFRSGLLRILREEFQEARILEASCCLEVREMVGKNDVDLLLLDISMRNENSLPIIGDLLRLGPRLKIIVLSMYDEKQFIVSAYKLGALGYLTKERAPEELIHVVKKVLAGQKFISEEAAQHLASYLTESDLLPHATLSQREYEIFIALASAKTVGQIAKELNISIKTVSTHRRRIMDKMGTHSNSDLMRYATKHNLIGAGNLPT